MLMLVCLLVLHAGQGEAGPDALSVLGGRPGDIQPDGAADTSRWGTHVTNCGAGGVVVPIQVLLILTLLTDPTTTALDREDTY